MPMDKELKILMLEDLEDDAGLIDRVLRKEGISFIRRRADTRDDFIKALNEFKPDVVLSDHALPQFNSVEALKICKDTGLDMPFILVTGTVSEEFAVNCLKQGADDYVLKSNLVRLPSAIINALRQRTIEAKRRKAERALRRQNEALVKINKELDSFVYSVSHNLRAPLMSVLGLIRLAGFEIERAGHKSQEVDGYFDMIEHSINKLDDTLKEILDYSRNARSNVQIEKTDLLSLIEDGFERLKFHEGSDSIRKVITINAQSNLYSDPYRLTVVLNNLISNAIKYRDVTKVDSYIRIEADITDQRALIRFADNGIGIPEPLQGRIFDMFFRATDKSEGAGLGLYIVKETLEKLEGNIQMTSVLGEGTTFVMEFPNHPDAEVQQALKKASSEIKPG